MLGPFSYQRHFQDKKSLASENVFSYRMKLSILDLEDAGLGLYPPLL